MEKTHTNLNDLRPKTENEMEAQMENGLRDSHNDSDSEKSKHHGHENLQSQVTGGHSGGLGASQSGGLNSSTVAETVQHHLDLFAFWIIGVQVAIVTLFYIFGRYTPSTDPNNNVLQYWQFLRDVGIMCLIGFGYLMTFLKRHRFSSIGYTFFVTVIVVEWHILVNGFYAWVLNPTGVDNVLVAFPQLIQALFCAASFLISFGVWIGKVGPEQLLFMGIAFVLFYQTNSYVIEGLLHVRDPGGTMVIHMFGAYFGLAAGKFVSPPDTRDRARYAGSSYTRLASNI